MSVFAIWILLWEQCVLSKSVSCSVWIDWFSVVDLKAEITSSTKAGSHLAYYILLRLRLIHKIETGSIRSMSRSVFFLGNGSNNTPNVIPPKMSVLCTHFLCVFGCTCWSRIFVRQLVSFPPPTIIHILYLIEKQWFWFWFENDWINGWALSTWHFISFDLFSSWLQHALQGKSTAWEQTCAASFTKSPTVESSTVLLWYASTISLNEKQKPKVQFLVNSMHTS